MRTALAAILALAFLAPAGARAVTLNDGNTHAHADAAKNFDRLGQINGSAVLAQGSSAQNRGPLAKAGPSAAPSLRTASVAAPAVSRGSDDGSPGFFAKMGAALSAMGKAAVAWAKENPIRAVCMGTLAILTGGALVGALGVTGFFATTLAFTGGALVGAYAGGMIAPLFDPKNN